MERFAGWVVKARIPIIVAVVLVTALSVFSIVKYSRVEADISKYLPPDDPVVASFNEAGELFGGVAVATVAVESDDLFTHEGLEAIASMTEAFSQVPGVTWVVSLTNVDDVKRWEEEGEVGVQVSKLIDPAALPESKESLRRLREYVLGKERLVGSLVSADGRLANIMVHISAEADRVEVATRLQQEAERLAGGRKLYFSGFPFWMKTLTETILADMTTLVPVVSLVVIIVLLLSFLSLRGVLLPLSTVLISSAWAMGLMAALDIPITTLSNSIPVLLIALGTAYAIHLLHKHQELGEGSSRQAANRAVAEVMVPIGLAGLTTVAGFLSFQTSNLLFIRQTGIIAAFGIFAAMLIAVTFVPAVLSFMRPVRRKKAVRAAGGGADRILGWVVRSRPAVLLVALAMAAGSMVFLPRLDRRFDMLMYFPEDSPVRIADEVMRRKLGGSVPVWVVVDGPVKHPFVLQTMQMVEKYLRTVPSLVHPQSIAGFVAEINEVMNGTLSIPSTAQGVGNLWLQLEGKDIMRQFVAGRQEHGLVQAMCKTADTGVLREVVAGVNGFLETLPTAAVAVERATADRDRLAEAQAFVAGRVARMILWDVAARLGAGVAPDHGWLSGWLVQRLDEKVELPPEEISRLVSEYLSSDEAEVEIEDRKLIQEIADAVAGGTVDRDVTGLERLLEGMLPSEVVEQDPESVGFLARSVAGRIRGLERERWRDGVLEKLLERLPARPARLVDELRGDLALLTEPVFYLPSGEAGADVKFSLRQTGMHHVSVTVDDGIVQSQLSSLGLAAVVAMVLLMLQLRSVWAGLIGMVPMLLTILVNFGVMGAFRFDLEPATVMIASLVVGVGIDYTIHFLARLRLENSRQEDLEQAVVVTNRSAGRAIIINALTVACGQLVFLLSRLHPLRIFGTLLALAMIVSALSAVALMPALVLWRRPRFLRRGN